MGDRIYLFSEALRYVAAGVPLEPPPWLGVKCGERGACERGVAWIAVRVPERLLEGPTVEPLRGDQPLRGEHPSISGSRTPPGVAEG